eukprot:g22647.t1
MDELPPRLPMLLALNSHRQYFQKQEHIYQCQDFSNHIFLVANGVFAHVGVAKESGGEDVNAISQGMGRWLAAVKVSVSEGSQHTYPYQLFSRASYFGEYGVLPESLTAITQVPGQLFRRVSAALDVERLESHDVLQNADHPGTEDRVMIRREEMTDLIREIKSLRSEIASLRRGREVLPPDPEPQLIGQRGTGTLKVYSDKDRSIEQKSINYVPGLYKIFDEILVNAADNYVRDNSQTYVKVTINEKEGSVTVENNGKGLPVEEHKEHRMYVPELVFGHLLTTKLTNIFSKRFEVECGDSERKKKYYQIWEGNMQTKQKPKITSHSGESFTKITFWPDLTRFGMKKLDKDCRNVDLAGTTPAKCKIFLNGQRLDISTFKDYIQMYTGTEDVQIVHEKCHERWEATWSQALAPYPVAVSFVNNIATPKGGTHVVHVADQLVEAITYKIENPSFDSQTKETLTLKAAKFGSSCHIPDKMIEKVLKTGIVDMVLQWARAKEEIDLGKTMKGGSSAPNKKTKRLLNIPKLEDIAYQCVIKLRTRCLHNATHKQQ